MSRIISKYVLGISFLFILTVVSCSKNNEENDSVKFYNENNQEIKHLDHIAFVSITKSNLYLENKNIVPLHNYKISDNFVKNDTIKLLSIYLQRVKSKLCNTGISSKGQWLNNPTDKMPEIKSRKYGCSLNNSAVAIYAPPDCPVSIIEKVIKTAKHNGFAGVKLLRKIKQTNNFKMLTLNSYQIKHLIQHSNQVTVSRIVKTPDNVAKRKKHKKENKVKDIYKKKHIKSKRTSPRDQRGGVVNVLATQIHKKQNFLSLKTLYNFNQDVFKPLFEHEFSKQIMYQSKADREGYITVFIDNKKIIFFGNPLEKYFKQQLEYKIDIKNFGVKKLRNFAYNKVFKKLRPRLRKNKYINLYIFMDDKTKYKIFYNSMLALRNLPENKRASNSSCYYQRKSIENIIIKYIIPDKTNCMFPTIELMIKKDMLAFYQDKMIWNPKFRPIFSNHRGAGGGLGFRRYRFDNSLGSLGLNVVENFQVPQLHGMSGSELIAISSGSRHGKMGRIGKRKILIRHGSASVYGKLDPNEVRAVIRAHRREVHHCYQKGLMINKKVAGSVRVSFIIATTGKVKSCSVTENLAVAKVGNCICDRLKTWKFPQPQGGLARVAYTWTLQPGD